MTREAREYWGQQRRANMRDRGNWSSSARVTIVIIGLLVLGTLLEGPLTTLVQVIDLLPGGFVGGLLIGSVFASGLLGLAFAGIFVWIIGTQIEGVVSTVQYVLIFFVGSAIGALAAGLVSGVLPFLATFGAYALAGAYAVLMSRWAGRGPSLQWILILLALNVILDFSVIALAGMVGAFLAGAGLLYVTEQGRGLPQRRRRF